MPIRSAVVPMVLAMLAFASPVHAFCGFYVAGGDAKLFNDATQVVLMRDGDRTALSMQNNYEGPPEDFAMVIPVPQVLQEENVRTLEKALFDKVDTMTAPRLVEYWEQDPCWKPRPRRLMKKSMARGAAAPSQPAPAEAEPLVVVEAEFSVAEYDVVILSARESTALETWLKAENYKIPDGAEPYFRPYIESGMYFFVAKVDPSKVKFEDGSAVLSPLRFHYESKDFQLPVRLGMINSRGKQDLIAYVIARTGRYEVANYPNVFIPTNLEVSNDVKDEFAGFYRALYDRTNEENPGAVVTEYSWSTASCDPCPGPTLSQGDLLTLGADVLVDPEGDEPSLAQPPDRSAKRRTVRPSPRRFVPGGWTVTRLHARYGRDEVGEDLVFRHATPVHGGNERRLPDGSLSTGAEEGSVNNFQGRYIIRHEWTGDANCENPQFGRWGGPPDGGSERIDVSPSANTRGPAAEPPKPVDLAGVLKTSLPFVKKADAAEPPIEPSGDVEEVPAATEDPTPEAKPTPPPATKKPFGCSTAADPGNLPGLALLGLLLFRRRRRD